MTDENKDTLSPAWFALSGFLTTPVIAMILLLGGIVLLVAWPLTPAIFYIKRKEAWNKAKEAKP